MSKLICALKDYENHLNSLKKDYEIYKDIEKPINFLYSSIKAGEIGIDKVVCNPEECRSTIYMINYSDKNEYTFNEELLSFLKRYPEISKNIENKTINLNSENHRFIEGGYFNLELKENKDFIGNIIEKGKKLANRGLKICAMTSGTDYFAFSNYGNTPVVVLGPGGDNVHAADEYVFLQDLIDLSKIFAGIIYDYCC